MLKIFEKILKTLINHTFETYNQVRFQKQQKIENLWLRLGENFKKTLEEKNQFQSLRFAINREKDEKKSDVKGKIGKKMEKIRP